MPAVLTIQLYKQTTSPVTADEVVCFFVLSSTQRKKNSPAKLLHVVQNSEHNLRGKPLSSFMGGTGVSGVDLLAYARCIQLCTPDALDGAHPIRQRMKARYTVKWTDRHGERAYVFIPKVVVH